MSADQFAQIIACIAFASDAVGNFVIQNPGKIKARGLMAASDLTLSNRLALRFGYTYTDSRVVSSDLHADWIGEQVAFIPKNKFDAALTYKADRARARPFARHASQSFGVNGLQFGAIGPAPATLAAFARDAHVAVDANFAYAIDKKAEVHLAVANLFDRRYIANNDGFAPPLLGTPRVFFAGVTLRID